MKNKLLSLLAIPVIALSYMTIVSCAPNTTVFDKNGLINELRAAAKYKGDGMYTINIASDIKFNENDVYGDEYLGSIDNSRVQIYGNGHTISNFKCESTNRSASLFGSGVFSIKNLKLDNISVKGKNCAGALCSHAKPGSYFIDVTVKNSKVVLDGEDGAMSGTGAGAMIGVFDGKEKEPAKRVHSFELDKCQSINCEVVSKYSAGGLVGIYGGAQRVTNCSSVQSKISSTSRTNDHGAGGLFGKVVINEYRFSSDDQFSFEVKDCVNESDVEKDLCAGGITGIMTFDNWKSRADGWIIYRTRKASYANCVNKGTITGSCMLGGIIGADYYESKSTTLTDCLNNGTIIGGNSESGGVLGYGSDKALISLRKCVNGETGVVKAFGGGVVGCAPGATLSNCKNLGTNYYAAGIAYKAKSLNGCIVSGSIYAEPDNEASLYVFTHYSDSNTTYSGCGFNGKVFSQGGVVCLITGVNEASKNDDQFGDDFIFGGEINNAGSVSLIGYHEFNSKESSKPSTLKLDQSNEAFASMKLTGAAKPAIYPVYRMEKSSKSKNNKIQVLGQVIAIHSFTLKYNDEIAYPENVYCCSEDVELIEGQ